MERCINMVDQKVQFCKDISSEVADSIIKLIPKVIFLGHWCSNSEIHMKGQSHYNILEEGKEAKSLLYGISRFQMMLQQLK